MTEEFTPLHNWGPHPDGWFHMVHASWIIKLCDGLNRGLLPDGYFAMAEQVVARDGEFENREKKSKPDVLAMEFRPGGAWAPAADYEPSEEPDAVAVADDDAWEAEDFAARKDRVSLRRGSDDALVSVIEIASRGNRTSSEALRSFREKTSGLLAAGVHCVVVDVHPPGSLDRAGLNQDFWDWRSNGSLGLRPGPSVTSYRVAGRGGPVRAYANPADVGEPVPGGPLFLEHNLHVPLPLSETYGPAFSSLPAPYRAEVDATV